MAVGQLCGGSCSPFHTDIVPWHLHLPLAAGNPTPVLGYRDFTCAAKHKLWFFVALCY
ncbi:hypothetical protein CCC_02737 [Paramagnetospirillum magnetotacticum MS-1]|uniref:Uncharacterized protein n=1 Tax=Paramagnetospirillum magnetotacticum MS-1 TaxID=272627 RepID=A0A0C2YXW5_PARME|nr:hypothetical protein CCC_02737 [Paramagnetospirillum magnetotacticum MS-1]